MPLIWRPKQRESLDPAFLAAIDALFAASPDQWAVTHARRSLEEQAALYGKGRTASQLHAVGVDPNYADPKAKVVTNARPGTSAHNYGLAIDVVPDGDPATPGLQPDWSPGANDGWAWLAAQLPDAHPVLRHGRNFTTMRGGKRVSLADWPHIELRDWKAKVGR